MTQIRRLVCFMLSDGNDAALRVFIIFLTFMLLSTLFGHLVSAVFHNTEVGMVVGIMMMAVLGGLLLSTMHSLRSWSGARDIREEEHR